MDERAEILATGSRWVRSARIVINSPAGQIFEVVANPAEHHSFDGSGMVKPECTDEIGVAALIIVSGSGSVGGAAVFRMTVLPGCSTWCRVGPGFRRRVRWSRLLVVQGSHRR